MTPLSFVHLTDTHFAATPNRPPYWTDPRANLRRILARVASLAAPPAFFIVSGDLSADGSEASYEQFTLALDDLRARCGVPVLLGLGNHDRRVPFRRVVLGQVTADDEMVPYSYSHWVGDLRVLMLDSVIPGAIDGALGAGQLAWLADQLRCPAPGGDLIVLHHPVLPRGLYREREYLLRDAGDLRRVVAEHTLLGILGGHSHVVSAAPFAGTLAITAPAVAYLADPGIGAEMRLLDGAGFNLCTVRDGTLIVIPVILPGAQRELLRAVRGSALGERPRQFLSGVPA